MALFVIAKRKKFTAKLFATFFGVLLLSQGVVIPYANAVAGVSSKLSYQGRLTNASGDPLSGTYYVCFSIFDAASLGTKLWPAGVPASNTVTVTNGVFNASVGVSNALNFDFSSNDTVYLNVGVSASNVLCDNVAVENLTPRQGLEATAYARVAADVYGTALRTSSTRVQAGAGTGQGTPIFTRFDNQNTGATIGGACPSGAVNGDMWYNSNNGKLLACNSNVIQVMSLLGNQFFDIAGPTVARTFTFPDSSATVLTSASAVTAGQGGTGLTATPTFGQILQGTGSGYALVATSTLGINFTDIIGTLSALRGGTGQTTYAVGDLLYASAVNVLSKLTKGTANQVLSMDGTGTNITWATPAGGGDMVLASAQTNSGLKTFLDATLGLRNVANTFTALFTNINTAARTYTLPDVSGTVLTSGAPVTVAQGGTGLATLTTGNVILGAGTGNVTFVSPATSGNILTANGTTWTSAAPPAASGLPKYNQSVTTPAAGFAADTYLVGSSITLATPATTLKVGSRYHLIFNVSKTAAGTATPIINIRYGTGGVVGDASKCAITFSAQTAAVDTGTFEVWATFRTVGSGTTAVLQCVGQRRHGLSITGFGTLVSSAIAVTSAGFDSTVANSILGASVNGGASAVWTITLVQATLENIN